MIEHGAIDIAQPSVTKIGGITEVRKIIALCDAFGVQVVPHCAYFGPGYMASMHIAASLPYDVPLERLFMDLEASPVQPLYRSRGRKRENAARPRPWLRPRSCNHRALPHAGRP